MGREGEEEGVGEIWKEQGVMITGRWDKAMNGEREYFWRRGRASLHSPSSGKDEI